MNSKRGILAPVIAAVLMVGLAMGPALNAAQGPVIPRDTVLKLVLNQELNSKDTKVGDKFTATLEIGRAHV